MIFKSVLNKIPQNRSRVPTKLVIHFSVLSTHNSLFMCFTNFKGFQFPVVFVISSITGFLTLGILSPEKFVFMIGWIYISSFHVFQQNI